MKRFLLLGLTLATLCTSTAQAQQPTTTRTLWTVLHGDPVGLRGRARSPAMYGAGWLLFFQPAGSPWSYGAELSILGSGTGVGDERFGSLAGGVTLEVRRALTTRGVRAYAVGTTGIKNVRVDEVHQVYDGYGIYGGSDATTAVLGGGLGIEAGQGRIKMFSDVQYQWRSNGIYGRSALPVRLGLKVSGGK